MKARKHLLAIILAILLGGCLLAYYSTRESGASSGQGKSAAAGQPLVDRSLLETAINLAAFAVTPEEQAQAREAWTLADHELDLRFAAAIRDAEAAASVPATGPLLQLSNRITQLQAQVDADKTRVAELAKDASGALERARAQLDLDQDQLDDAKDDLAREGGNKGARLQQLLQEHEASDKIADQTMKFGAPGSSRTMSEQLGQWFALRGYNRRLQAAAQQAASQSQSLLQQHNLLQRQLPVQPDASASVARLRQMAAQQKTITGLDQRIEDTKELVAAVYGSWSALVVTRRRAVLHLVLGSLALILGIVLAAALLNGAVRGAFRRGPQRRLRQIQVIARITVQALAILSIVVVLFGLPTQISTMIGLITAGITVVMKDFIVAFFGWFTLMGKNGISVGDWVEIEGVSGEVIEIGLLKTVLLELGNWTETGHPTGRRVAFSNGFAIEGHYFNFSTSGQWLWDELRLTLPSAGDPYSTAQQMRGIVERETQADAAEAAKEWERVTRQYGARGFSATPAISLRPGANGLEVVVRYITRAPQRNAVKAKLFQAMVDLFRKPAVEEKASLGA